MSVHRFQVDAYTVLLNPGEIKPNVGGSDGDQHLSPHSSVFLTIFVSMTMKIYMAMNNPVMEDSEVWMQINTRKSSRMQSTRK
jgi:hypothetical protein